MKAALVAMVLLGCDCDEKQCELIRETPAQWVTLADCQVAAGDLARAEGVDRYPLVTGRCRSLDQSTPSVADDGTLVAVGWSGTATLVNDAGSNAILATVKDGGRAVLGRTAAGYALVSDTVSRAIVGSAGWARSAGTTVAASLPAF